MKKYLAASSGDQLDSKISGRFGHAKYFLLVDPSSMDYEVIPGVAPDEERPGMSRLTEKGAGRVLTGNIGPSSFHELRSEGLQVYLCRGMTVSDAVQKVEDGDLSPLEEPTLKESLHSPRKASEDKSDVTGRGLGRGDGSRKGAGKGPGKGSGKGRGKGRKR